MIDYGFWIGRPTLLNIAGTVAGYCGSGRWMLALVILFFVFSAAGIFILPEAEPRLNRRAHGSHFNSAFKGHPRLEGRIGSAQPVHLAQFRFKIYYRRLSRY